MTSALESASLEASRMPPGGLMVEQVPLFVSIGFDDNQSGVETTLKIFDKYKNPTRSPSSSATYDGTATRVTYFHTTNYNNFGVLTAVWEEAASKGHETGNHTKKHINGMYFSLQQWHEEVGDANTHLLSLNGIDNIYGFRTPFLAYNSNLFKVLKDSRYRFEYDCSIGEGEKASGNGMNFHWPYTLDWGSHADPAIGAHPGLWELPVYALMVIPDAALENYGLSASNSLIQKLGATKITGFDYNLIQKGVSGPEFAALLKYNLDLRLAGNRAPLLFGAHAANYPNEGHEYSVALSDFLAYATSKSAVRVVPFIEIVRWMENPQAFATNSKSAHRVEVSVVPEEVVSGNPCEVEIWSTSKTYNADNEVKYNGKLWRAKWWTQGNEPGNSQHWEDIGECETITLLYHGTTNPTGSLEILEGEDFTLTILPDEGYAVDKIVVNGENFSGTTQLKLSSLLESKKIEVHFKMDSSWRSHTADNAISFDVWAQDQGLSGD